MPRSYFFDAMPGMIASKVALVTFAFRPMTFASALARSASIPTTVLPSLSTDSIGG